MNIEKFTVSNDPDLYEAFPDVVLTPGGKLICVFNECTHHCDRSYTRIMLTESTDRGRTWSPKHPLTEGTTGLSYYYNCPRISRLADHRLVVIVDKIPRSGETNAAQAKNVMYFSVDEGKNWSSPQDTALNGIVPDKVLQLDSGRIIIAAHYPYKGKLTEFLRYSDDACNTWSDEVMVAHDKRFDLCEASLLPMGNGVIVAFLRENSQRGLDCMKVISSDHGESWGPIVQFPLPGCHRPVAGWLQDGRIFITFRFIQGGSWNGAATQNFFGALTDQTSALAVRREDAGTRIMPIDYDASPKADLGYSGWVQFPDQEIYIVNYIVDDAMDKGQIRGYSIKPSTFLHKNPQSIASI